MFCLELKKTTRSEIHLGWTFACGHTILMRGTFGAAGPIVYLALDSVLRSSEKR